MIRDRQQHVGSRTAARKIAAASVLAVIVSASLLVALSGVARAAVSLDSSSEATYTTGSSSSSFSLSATLSGSGELVVATLSFRTPNVVYDIGNDHSLFTLTANGNTMAWIAGAGGSIKTYNFLLKKYLYTNFGENTWIYNTSSLASGSYTVHVSVSTYVGWAISAGIYALAGVSLQKTVGTVGSAGGGSLSFTPQSGSGIVIWTGGAFSGGSITWDSPIVPIQSANAGSGAAIIYDADGPVQSYTTEASTTGTAYITGIQIFGVPSLTYSMTLSNGLSYFSVSFPTGRGSNVQSAPGQSSSVAGISISLTAGSSVSVTLALNRTLPSGMNIQYSTTSTEPALGSNYLTTSAVTVYSGVNAPSTMNIWLWFIVNNQYVGTATLNETVGILVTVLD